MIRGGTELSANRFSADSAKNWILIPIKILLNILINLIDEKLAEVAMDSASF